MDDAAHIGLVYAHAKGIGGHDQPTLALHEGILRLSTLRIAQTGVVDEPCSTTRVQEARDLLDSAARRGVDNDAARSLGIHNLSQRLQFRGLPAQPKDTIGEIGAVKPGDKALHVFTAQLLHNVVLHLHSRGRGQGEDLRLLEILDSLAQTQVIRAEIVPPLRDTVRLIHRKERHARLGDGI